MTDERITITARIDRDLHDWLMDHRDSDKRSLSDVMREVIDFRIDYNNQKGKHMLENYDKIHEKMLTSAKYHNIFESDKWRKVIPAFKIKPDWLIQIIPPVTGAIIRFRISKEGYKHHEFISVYLDCYDLLGYMNGPYWEAYAVDGDTWRCAMDDVDCLMEGIEKGLQQIEDKNTKPDVKEQNDD